MAKLYVSLTPEEVRASIPYDLICMVRYGCTWNQWCEPVENSKLY